ncbi:MAG: DUF4143 domain-containing protein [Clostridiales Family XIII bacterium]|jgi:predicted AAA+ superfamily ATPase|nr:DUF4143 domain-containing protein [Clostridiales Family XIII bacterium]
MKRDSDAYTDKAGATAAPSYLHRIADGLLADALQKSGAVQIVGPKWCGKTTTAVQAAAEVVYLQDPDQRESYRRIAREQPSLLLRGQKPLLLDEWQDIPVLWDAVRFAVDKENTPGGYILTGSAVPREGEEILHTGTGRFSRIVMRPMSLYESGESDGSVSLSEMIEGAEPDGKSLLSLEEIAFALIRGGWPASVTRGGRHAAGLSRDYVDSLIETDVSRVDGIEKNPRRARLLMRSLARNESTQAAMTTLQSDMAADDGKLSVNTIAVYLHALRCLYVLDEQEAWMPAVRSKTSIRTSPVRRYCDPSLAAALLGLTPEKLLTDFHTFGLLFESLCIRDLRVYAEAIGGTITHYRDARGLECDAIIEMADGSWGAVEIKLTKDAEDKAAANLQRIADKVRSQHGGRASFLLIVTAGGYAYRRKDGVNVVPVGCLRP